MDDLISRKHLLRMMAHWKPYMDMGLVRQAVEKFPAVDAVEVVRCKDCKHYVPVASAFFDVVMCCTRQGSMNILKTEKDFCSWGGRKENV